ncbi:hypothetical protein [Neisseria musculi]|uniref:hypothetical protein n=1 Tax=Neisseria musculi TaxID=1815583 RepID=UPI001BE3F194|nr:hypothetical protein [Neisseria musculi]
MVRFLLCVVFIIAPAVSDGLKYLPKLPPLQRRRLAGRFFSFLLPRGFALPYCRRLALPENERVHHGSAFFLND